jgi:hypothetical protein
LVRKVKRSCPVSPICAAPERHDLHEAACAGARNGVFAKVAFGLDEAEHKLRVEAGAGRLVLHRDQEVAACGPVRAFFDASRDDMSASHAHSSTLVVKTRCGAG